MVNKQHSPKNSSPPQVHEENGFSIVSVSLSSDAGLDEATETLNALCATLAERPGSALAFIQLEGAGASFPYASATIQDLNRWERVLRKAERLDAPTILSASGICGGLSLDVMLVSDIRTASDDFYLHLPSDEGAFWPGMALYRLVQQTSLAKARQIVLHDGGLSLPECLSIGLIDKHLADPQRYLLDAPYTFTRRQAQSYPVLRRLMTEASASAYEDAIGTHLAACDRSLRGANHV